MALEMKKKLLLLTVIGSIKNCILIDNQKDKKLFYLVASVIIMCTRWMKTFFKKTKYQILLSITAREGKECIN